MVLVFVGEITFSSLVLQNVGAVSIYRLLITVDLLAFILINVICMLVKFIFVINEKPYGESGVKHVNVICLVFVVCILIL